GRMRSVARPVLDADLSQLEAQLQEEGERVLAALRGSMRALLERDDELADEVVGFDDEVDRLYVAIEEAVQTLIALRGPVASDLRLLLAIIKINLHLERMADYCVTIAKLSKLVSSVEPDSALVDVLGEMGNRAEEMLSVALASFARRDLAGTGRIGELDERLDRTTPRSTPGAY